MFSGVRALSEGGVVAVRRVLRGRLVGVVGVTVAALLATFLATAPPAAVAAAAGEAAPVVRPDSGSAMQSAIALGERVEDLSQRSEFGSVFANPDGTWGQVRWGGV